MDARELRVVAATTTLAEGIDLPFRVTILADWLNWGRQGQRPMSSLLFRNIAGRCGRAGVYTEGDTLIFDNPVGPPQYTFSPARSGYQQNVFLREAPEELRSVVELITGEGADDLYAVLASQFIAAIPENPVEEDLVEAFAQAMYAETRGDARDRSRILLRGVREQLLRGDGETPLAVADSPLRLTSLGEAANASQFSPTTVVRFLEFLRNGNRSWEMRDVAASVLSELGDVPEQLNPDIRFQVERAKRGFPVHPDDYETLVDGWLEGVPLPQLFASMPVVRRSSREPSVDIWIEGYAEPSTWDEAFDKFYDFVQAALAGFVPWSFRAFGHLAPFADSPAAAIDWFELASALEDRAEQRPELDPLN